MIKLVKSQTAIANVRMVTMKIKDEPKFVQPGHASLFIEVENLADIQKRLEGYPIAMAERRTFYGMKRSSLAKFAILDRS